MGRAMLSKSLTQFSVDGWNVFLLCYLPVAKLCWGFPGGSEVKASAWNAGDQGSIPGSGRSPGEGNGNPLQLPGESHGRRSLVGYSLWGQKESDMTERLHFHFLSFQTMLEVMKIMVTSLKRSQACTAIVSVPNPAGATTDPHLHGRLPTPTGKSPVG